MSSQVFLGERKVVSCKSTVQWYSLCNVLMLISTPVLYIYYHVLLHLLLNISSSRLEKRVKNTMTDHWPCKYHLHGITLYSPSQLEPRLKLLTKLDQKVCQKVSKNDTTLLILMVHPRSGRNSLSLTLQSPVTISVDSSGISPSVSHGWLMLFSKCFIAGQAI